MKVRVLIVDDEQLALNRLTRLLEQAEDVEVVGAAETGSDALDAIKRLHPDLVLLDVEMPQMDGFDVVEALGRHCSAKDLPPPLIAFVTAYPHFAVEAFETGAIDFLCKPVRLPRLEKMLGRARSALTARDATRRLDALRTNLKELRGAAAHIEERHIWVRHRGELLRIRAGDIEWVEAEAAYVNLHLSKGSYLIRNSIGSLADELSDEGFVRVHKSALVNRNKVERVATGDRIRLVLHSGAEVPVGRKFREALRKIVAPT